MKLRKIFASRRLIMSLILTAIFAAFPIQRVAACTIGIVKKQPVCCEGNTSKCEYLLQLNMCKEAEKVERERPEDFHTEWSFVVRDPEVIFKKKTLLSATVGLQNSAKANKYKATVKCKVTYDGSICEPTVPIEFTILNVDLEEASAGNSPDISPKICINAQDEYKKAKWTAVVKASGNAMDGCGEGFWQRDGDC